MGGAGRFLAFALDRCYSTYVEKPIRSEYLPLGYRPRPDAGFGRRPFFLPRLAPARLPQTHESRSSRG
jgi:hypothetical protein